MNAPKAPTQQAIAMPPTDGWYAQDYVLVGGVQTAASLPVFGFDGPNFRQYGDSWLAHMAASRRA